MFAHLSSQCQQQLMGLAQQQQRRRCRTGKNRWWGWFQSFGLGRTGTGGNDMNQCRVKCRDIACVSNMPGSWKMGAKSYTRGMTHTKCKCKRWFCCFLFDCSSVVVIKPSGTCQASHFFGYATCQYYIDGRCIRHM